MLNIENYIGPIVYLFSDYISHAYYALSKAKFLTLINSIFE